MPETDIRTLLKLETDSRGVKEAQRALASILDQQQKLKAQFERGDVGVKQFGDEMRRLAKEEKDAASAIRTVTDTIDEQADSLSKNISAVERRQQAFDEVSQSVAGAGDVESGLRSLGGAAGAIGAGGLAQGLGGAGELAATIETLPRLKAAAQGLPDVIDAAAASFGTSSTGFIGALGAAGLAIAAIQLAIQAFTAEAKKQAEEISSIIEARRSVGQEIIQGGIGTEEADARIAENARLRELEQQILEDTNRAIQQAIAGQDTYGVALIASTEQFKALQEQAARSTELIASYKAEDDALRAARESGQLTTAKAQEAEIQLEATRKASVGAIQNVTKAEQDRASTSNKATQATQSFARTSAKTVQSQKSGLNSLAKSAEDSRKKLAEVEKKFAEDELDLRQDLSDKRVDEQINFRRELQQIDRNFDDQRADSLGEGNFLALAQTNKDEKRAQVEARIRNREQNQDITREGERAHRDLLTQKQRQLQELATVEHQFQQNSIKAARTWGDVIMRTFQNFFQNSQKLVGGKQSLQNAPRTPG